MLWLTTFYRSNFTFGQEIKQTADVIFECDSEDENDLNDAAWKAMIIQTGWENKHNLPFDQGWSSVLTNFKYKKIELPYNDRKIQYPTDQKPVIACRFKVKDNYYRANAFYKLEKYKIFQGDDPATQIMREMEIEEGKDPDRDRYRMVKCLPENADFVSGSGVCGIIEPIKNIKIEGLVNWNDIQIKQAQGQYEDMIANYSENDIMVDSFQLGPHINRYKSLLEN